MSRYDDLNKVWDDRTFDAYASATGNPWGWIIGGIVGLILFIGLIVFVGWEADWWFANQNTNRESHIIRNSYSNQQTIREQITQNVGNVLSISTEITQTTDPAEKAALSAQRKAVVVIVCGAGAQLTGDPLASEQQSFLSNNCEAGTIKPGSQYDN